MNARSGDRISALRDLLELRRSVADVSAALARFGWDSDVELATLTTSDIVSVLDRYLDGTVTSGDVETWTEALIGRDDVAFQEGVEDLLKEAIFELSTPEIHEPITSSVANCWKQRLET